MPYIPTTWKPRSSPFAMTLCLETTREVFDRFFFIGGYQKEPNPINAVA